MMKLSCLADALVAAGLTSACGPKTETNMAAASLAEPDAGASADIDDLAKLAEAKIAKSTGTVTATDKAAGKITVWEGSNG